MSKQPLSKSATISDVIPTLGDAEDYICGVLNKMFLCKRQHGNAIVRIGVTGKGIYPAYRVEYETGGAGLGGSEGAAHSPVKLHGAYGGQNHRDFTDVEIQESTWSPVSMTIDELQAALGTLRSVKKARPQRQI